MRHHREPGTHPHGVLSLGPGSNLGTGEKSTKEKDIPWDTPTLGTILGCAIKRQTKKEERQPGKERAYAILMSEAAFLIWKIRCEWRIEFEQDEERAHTETKIENRYGTKATDPKLVEATWSGLLEEHQKQIKMGSVEPHTTVQDHSIKWLLGHPIALTIGGARTNIADAQIPTPSPPQPSLALIPLIEPPPTVRAAYLAPSAFDIHDPQQPVSVSEKGGAVLELEENVDGSSIGNNFNDMNPPDEQAVKEDTREVNINEAVTSSRHCQSRELGPQGYHSTSNVRVTVFGCIEGVIGIHQARTPSVQGTWDSPTCHCHNLGPPTTMSPLAWDVIFPPSQWESWIDHLTCAVQHNGEHHHKGKQVLSEESEVPDNTP
ncbi:hypothetical protein DFP72DRAFT_860599 [Ephemerocybe angulata]|uniref:Uncharacterized protein n=1 Tax=Ephemerocybe angulata TaxID=980116 RepID=A0A8H6H8G3_9AGAR|nr:hypothetical protein DFP72DRAFT_860599 [Tulosesus angulatus]